MDALHDQVVAALQLPAGSKLICNEELSPTNYPTVDQQQTIKECELQHGDILVWTLENDGSAEEEWIATEQFMLNTYHAQKVEFRELSKAGEPGFVIDLDGRMKHDEVVKRVAERLEMPDYRYLQLSLHETSRLSATGGPGEKIDSESMYTLTRLIQPLYSRAARRNGVLVYYERLEIPIAELEQLVTLEVEFLHMDPKVKVTGHTVHVAVGDTVESLIVSTLKAAESDANPADCRLVKHYLNRIKDYSINPTYKWDSVWSKFDEYRVEVVPEAEKAASDENTRVVECFHFFKVPVRSHGIPFMFTVKNGESVGDLRERIRAHLKVPKAQFSKWKFGVEVESESDLGTMELVVHELTDDDYVVDFTKIPQNFALGLDHVDRSNTFSHNPGAIKIHN